MLPGHNDDAQPLGFAHVAVQTPDEPHVWHVRQVVAQHRPLVQIADAHSESPPQESPNGFLHVPVGSQMLLPGQLARSPATLHTSDNTVGLFAPATHEDALRHCESPQRNVVVSTVAPRQ